jgi:hypothetical protein
MDDLGAGHAEDVRHALGLQALDQPISFTGRLEEHHDGLGPGSRSGRSLALGGCGPNSTAAPRPRQASRCGRSTILPPPECMNAYSFGRPERRIRIVKRRAGTLQNVSSALGCGYGAPAPALSMIVSWRDPRNCPQGTSADLDAPGGRERRSWPAPAAGGRVVHGSPASTVVLAAGHAEGPSSALAPRAR